MNALRTVAATVAAALLVILAAPAHAALPTGDESTRSEAVTQPILDALAVELERATSSLRIDGAPAPYFISYKVTEVEVNDAVASLGSITAKKRRHFVALEAHVHIGSYDRDNSNFVDQRREELDGIVTLPLALEATPEQARRVAWIATDAAYKEALEQARAKADAVASGATTNAGLPSYTKGEPVVAPEPVLVPELESLELLEKRAKKVSETFRDRREIRDSRVAFTSFLERRWYLNSEGTSATDTRRVSGLIMVASAQASDGQEVALTFSRYGYTDADLPQNGELLNEADELAARLTELRNAPRAEAYTGPVLFEGEGAVGVVRYTLAPHLSGTPPPVGVSSGDDARLAGALTQRLDLRVISPLLGVVDDPTTHTSRGKHIIGGYQIDDEGVKAQRVEVIRRGKLEKLLMSRTPNEDQRESNGHARLSMPGGVFRGSATNLFLRGKRALSRKALRRKLIAEVKAQGLPYGIIIRKFDDPAMTANEELTRLELLQLLQGMNRDAPPWALLTYRVYPDGREELVRGVQPNPIDMRAWRDVMAVSRNQTVSNFLASTGDPFLMRVGGVGPGFVPSTGVESSITTPDLLFEEIELEPSAFGTRPKPLLPAP